MKIGVYDSSCNGEVLLGRVTCEHNTEKTSVVNCLSAVLCSPVVG